ncbi:MAG: SPASM domain-containing protein [Planctomycetota bacterium]
MALALLLPPNRLLPGSPHAGSVGPHDPAALALQRALTPPSITAAVLIVPTTDAGASAWAGLELPKPVHVFPHPALDQPLHPDRTAAARRFAPHAWRGGLGQATLYDELMPALPLADALDHFDEDAALIARLDWCCLDPGLAEQQLAVHLDAPEAMKLTFTQAPPGLSPLVTSRTVLRDFAEHDAGPGDALRYNPKKPTIDPIGREANIPINASIRDHARRFIADTPDALARLTRLADHLGDRFPTADAELLTATNAKLEADDFRSTQPLDLPRELHLELTPRRTALGPITPQHHLPELLERPDLDPSLARSLFDQLGPLGDAVLYLGHHGEPTLHPEFINLVHAARDAGIPTIALQTDLLLEREDALALLDLPVDAIQIRLNADTAAVYEAEMGLDRFKQAADNTLALLHERQNRSATTPWIIPSLTKVTGTLKDMESFFERWVTVCGHALIEPFPTANGVIPARFPVDMTPPKPDPARFRVKHRLTVLADGSVTPCRHDLLGRASLGNANDAPLVELYARLPDLTDAQAEALCWRCQAHLANYPQHANAAPLQLPAASSAA